MAEQQTGFLGPLGISDVDERDVVQAQRDNLASQRQQRMVALGRQAGRGVAGVAGGFLNRNQGGFGAAFKQAHVNATDQDVAQQMGVTVEQLRGRRKVRGLASTSEAQDPSHEGRISLLNKIIGIANRSGDTELLGNSLRQLDAVKKEQEEFDKLKAETRGKKSLADGLETVSAYDHEKGGKEFVGVRHTNEAGINGLMTTVKGEPVFRPFSDTFGLTPPDELRATRLGETPTQLIKKSMSAVEWNSLRGGITANSAVVQRYSRMLGTLAQAAKDGNVQSILQDAGSVTSWLSNRIRGIRGVLQSASSSMDPLSAASHRKGGDSGTERFTSRADMDRSPNNPLWDLISLPDGMEFDAGQAQVLKGQIMDMAYIMARAAEPSNRGLSDNDIKAALVKFGADSGNPAVMMRRAMELMRDGSEEIDRRLQGVYGTVYRPLEGGRSEQLSNEQIDIVLGGEALGAYRRDVATVFAQHGFEPRGLGGVSTNRPIDFDTSPNTDDLWAGGEGAIYIDASVEEDIIATALDED